MTIEQFKNLKNGDPIIPAKKINDGIKRFYLGARGNKVAWWYTIKSGDTYIASMRDDDFLEGYEAVKPERWAVVHLVSAFDSLYEAQALINRSYSMGKNIRVFKIIEP